ncbi:MAG: endonuclease/exonuclease/phosphatase family protein [Saprospiraceae bacterium]
MITRVTFLALYCLILSSFTADAQLDVMTYNLRYATESDGENAWSKRKADVAALIRNYHPSVLGVQEAVHEQMAYLDSTFTEYAYVGVGRDDGATGGEYSAIFYDSTQLRCIASETFWLSETPSEPSYGWGANYRRICTYVSFIVRSHGDTIHVFNAHFDHEVELARLNGAQVILDKVTAKHLLNSQVVVMGDFNCTASDPPMQLFNSKFAFGADVSLTSCYGPKSTFSGFEELQEGKTLDHILLRNLDVVKYRHIDDRRPNGLWPSDHLPVTATLRKP